MIERISDNVWKIKADSNIYVLFKEQMVIDTGSRANRAIVEQFLSKIIPFEQVERVVFTHLHYDHIGNFDLFKKAEYYASQAEINSWKKDAKATILEEDMAEKFKDIKLSPLPAKIDGLEVINTPGHTKGSVCLWDEKEKILFTGDTMLKRGPGRTDFPTSTPEIQNSMIRLIKYNYRILCPGHEY